MNPRSVQMCQPWGAVPAWTPALRSPVSGVEVR